MKTIQPHFLIELNLHAFYIWWQNVFFCFFLLAYILSNYCKVQIYLPTFAITINVTEHGWSIEVEV